MKTAIGFFCRMIRRLFRKTKFGFVRADAYLKRHLRYSFHDVSMCLAKMRIPNFRLDAFLGQNLESISKVLNENKALRKCVISAADAAMQNKFLILNEYRDGMFDEENGHYKWNVDFFSGHRYKQCFYQDVRSQNPFNRGADIKVPWETSRMQYLFSLALAYRATRDDKYVQKILNIIFDFAEQNPFNIGVNWDTSMEVGIRLSNIVLACELVQDSPLFSLKAKKQIAIIGLEHKNHIQKNLESLDNGGNHLFGDLLGLAVACSAFPFFDKKNSLFSFTSTTLRKELLRQIMDDGGDFECSTSYQRLVGEMIAFAIIPLTHRGFKIGEEERHKLSQMAAFSIALSDKNGAVPQIGDNDSGRVFQLFPEDSLNHTQCINLLSLLASNGLYNSDYLFKNGFFCFFDRLSVLEHFPKKSSLSMFPNTGIAHFECPLYSLTCAATNPEKWGKSGHVHNDFGSFVLKFGCDEFITDAGTGEYTANYSTRNRFRSAPSHSTIVVDNEEYRRASNERAFGWDGVIKNCAFSFCNDERTVFSANLEYLRSDNQIVVIRRKLLLADELVEISDHIEGMTCCCCLFLPLHPLVSITHIEEHAVIITRGEFSLRLTGSWTFSVTESQYSPQYKKIVSNHTIIGYSQVAENSLVMRPSLFSD